MEEIDIEKLVLDYNETTDIIKKYDIGSHICQYYLNSLYDFELMRKYALELLKLSTEEKNNEMRVRFLQFIGISHTMEGNHHSAKSIFNEALFIALDIGNKFIIAMSFMNLGTTEHYMGNLYNALQNYIKALDVYESIEEIDTLHNEELDNGKVRIFTNIGILFNEVKNPTEAIIWCKKALKIKSQCKNPMIYYYIGGCYIKLKDYALALGYFKRAIKYTKDNADIYYHIASHVNIAHIYIEKNKYDQAEYLLRRSFNFCEQNKMNDLVLEISGMLAFIYFQRKQYDIAEQHFQSGLEIVPHIQNDIILKGFYEQYSEFLKETGNITDAYSYLKKTAELNTKIYNEDLERTMTFLAARNESTTKE